MGNLRIEACRRLQCFSVGISYSKNLEEDENFQIILFRNGLDNHIIIGTQSITTVTILDDDSKFGDFNVLSHD